MLFSKFSAFSSCKHIAVKVNGKIYFCIIFTYIQIVISQLSLIPDSHFSGQRDLFGRIFAFK